MLLDELVLPYPLEHQEGVIAHPSKRKLWRAGRRTGKTRAAFIMGVDGHGPDVDGRPAMPGILQGGDIVWLAPDFPQSQAIWREEVLPRFDGRPGVDLNLTERRVSIDGLGSLEIRSAENIDGVRGRKLDGVIIDEAAHLDLEYALNAVLFYTLIDRDGWLFLMSTTNGAHDGNSAQRTPSYFNLLVEEIEAGKRPGWRAWHSKTEDNKRLPQGVIQEMRDEVGRGSLREQEEMDALLVAGGGRFYPEVLQELPWVTVERDTQSLQWAMPDWCDFWGSYDWGFSHPAAYCQFARQGNTVTLLDTTYMRRYQDEEQGADLRGNMDPRCRATVYAGHDAFAKRMAHSASAETVADVMDRYGIRLTRANIDRAAGAKAVRRLFAPVPANAARGAIQLRLNDTPGNRRLIDELGKLVPDRLNFDVPAKRDADERGLNGDDGADAFRYGVASAGLEVMEPIVRKERSNVSDGRDENGEDPWSPTIERTRSGFTTEYTERPPGPEGQFLW